MNARLISTDPVRVREWIEQAPDHTLDAIADCIARDAADRAGGHLQALWGRRAAETAESEAMLRRTQR